MQAYGCCHETIKNLVTLHCSNYIMLPTKNLIFDLGNVLYDIDFKKMNEGFTSIGIKNIESHFTLNQSHPLFLDLEMGFVNESAFFDGFRTLANLPLTNDQIITAWNSLLVGFRKSSIEWVKENNKTYPTFLYSNTNQIHCDHFIPEFEKEVADYPFESLFQKPYYSHDGATLKWIRSRNLLFVVGDSPEASYSRPVSSFVTCISERGLS